MLAAEPTWRQQVPQQVRAAPPSTNGSACQTFSAITGPAASRTSGDAWPRGANGLRQCGSGVTSGASSTLTPKARTFCLYSSTLSAFRPQRSLLKSRSHPSREKVAGPGDPATQAHAGFRSGYLWPIFAVWQTARAGRPLPSRPRCRRPAVHDVRVYAFQVIPIFT